MILRQVMRLAVLLVLLCIAPVALIRAQPYDDGGLRAGLAPTADCPAPCFMGVRPGVTTLQEFVTIMARHGWVGESFRADFTAMIGQSGGGRVSPNPIMVWEWDAAMRPGWISARQAGAAWVPGGRVTVMLVETDIALGDFLLAFGEPDRVTLTSIKDDPVLGINGYEYEYTAWYTQHQMIVSTGGVCSESRLYDWPVRLFFQAVPEESGEVVRLDVCR